MSQPDSQPPDSRPDAAPDPDAARGPAGAAARPLLIHVGYHKTATSWLQKTVLLERFGFHTVMRQSEVFAQIIAPHGLVYDPARPRATVAAAQAAAPAGAAVDCISLEALTGLPYCGNRESDAYARRLHAAFPQARILITIREQCAVMASAYMQYLFRAGTQPPRVFFDEAPPEGFFKFSTVGYEYDRLVALYQALFGAERVLVLPQETIAADQPGAVATLARFSGNAPLAARGWQAVRERGTSYPQFGVPLLRRVNHLRRGAMNPWPMLDLGAAGTWLYRGCGWVLNRAPAGWRRRRPVTAHLERRFAGRFAESNRRLRALLGPTVDLGGYQGIAAGPPPADADRPALAAEG